MHDLPLGLVLRLKIRNKGKVAFGGLDAVKKHRNIEVTKKLQQILALFEVIFLDIAVSYDHQKEIILSFLVETTFLAVL